MIVFCLTLLNLPVWPSAHTIVNLTIAGAENNGGKIYVAVFNSETTFKARKVYLSFVLDADNETIKKDLNLPNGEYLFAIYQDGNGNGKLDTNLLGIPKERFGFSNYGGKIPPGGFKRHKVEITGSSKDVEVTLYKF